MSAKATFWAWEQVLPHSTKIVLLSLANYANDKDESWHGMESLAKACGMSKRSIINKINDLEKAGLLCIIRRKKDGVLNDTNFYKLIIKASIPSERDSLGQVKEIHHPSERDSPPLVKDVHPNLKDKSKRESKKETRARRTVEIAAPDCVDQESWNEFLTIRKTLKAQNTERAIKMLVNKLEEFEQRRPGDAQKSLNESILNSWKSVFPVKQQNEHKTGSQNRMSRDERRSERNKEILSRVAREEGRAFNTGQYNPFCYPLENWAKEGVTIDG